MPYHTLAIDSRNRTAGTSHSFTANLKTSIPHTTTIECVNASIPYSFYNVHEGNNAFRLIRENETTIDLTIAEGNYYADSFISAVQTLINAELSGTVTISYSDLLTKFTFTHSAANTQWGLDFTIDNAAHELFGFERQTSNVNLSTAPNVFNLTGAQMIAVNVSEIGADTSTLLLGTDKTIANVPVNTRPGCTIHYAAAYEQPFALHKEALSTLHISLTRTDGSVLDMNGVDWNLTLRFASNTI